MLGGTHTMPSKGGIMSNQAMPSASFDCTPEALLTCRPSIGPLVRRRDKTCSRIKVLPLICARGEDRRHILSPHDLLILLSNGACTSRLP